jgi:hypothetical protein
MVISFGRAALIIALAQEIRAKPIGQFRRFRDIPDRKIGDLPGLQSPKRIL